MSVVMARCFRRVLLGPTARWAALMLSAIAASASAQVLVVLSDEAGGYQEVAQELRERSASVREGRLRIDVISAQRLSGIDDPTLSAYESVVTVGLVAAQATIAREAAVPIAPPTLCLLIPRQSFERLASGRTGGRDRRLSAVFIDQPLSRQLDLIRIALPDKSRLGVILGPSSQSLKDELIEGARERALTLHVADVAETTGIYHALQGVMPESDVLLALPDPAVINSASVYGFLLASYRGQIPVVGYSEALVKAGALLSLSSSPRQQGRQGAEIVSRILAGEAGLPAPQYPKYFTIRVNGSVARSFGLRIPDETSLSATLAGRLEAPGQGLRTRSSGDPPVPKGTP